MEFLKNKHLILAMFIAPTLAVIAYFGVDYIVSEKPQSAQQGKSYRLAAKSNCRYQSGVCTLVNGDIEVQLQAERIDDRQVGLTLRSAAPIRNALVAYVTADTEPEPEKLQKTAAKPDALYVALNMDHPEQGRLRLALDIAGSTYYAETTAVFVDYVTSFSRENFNN